MRLLINFLSKINLSKYDLVGFEIIRALYYIMQME